MNRKTTSRIIYLYRIVSWALTSAYYLTGEPKAPAVYKWSVAVSLLAAALLISRIYITFQSKLGKIRVIAFTETFGLSLLLVPTGGLDSPFLWYALNPVLVAASFLKVSVCWFLLLFYTISAGLVTLCLFPADPRALNSWLHEKSYLLLILFMVTLFIQLMSKTNRELVEYSERLTIEIAQVKERLYKQEAAGLSLVVEEQHRIAGEMHDSVSQRLFGIVYALHAVKSKWKHVSPEECLNELEAIRSSAHTVAQEMRSIIYRLASQYERSGGFSGNVRSYLKDIGALNGIQLHYDMDGGVDELPVPVKKALYRVICEAAGNAVRHGGCRALEVKLQADTDRVRLRIADDGIGFAVEELERTLGKGLGVNHMRQLIQALDGSFAIRSAPRKGTEISVEIPRPEWSRCNVEGVQA